MTKKEAIQKRRKDILEELRCSDQEHPIPLADLMERYDASRRTIYDDIKALQDSGYNVETLSKKGFYLSKEKKEEESGADDTPTTEYAYTRKGLYRKSGVESFMDVMLMITIQLSEKPLTIEEIIPLYERTCSYDQDDSDSITLAVTRKVKLLTDQGYLVEENGRYETSLSAPVYLPLTEGQIEELNDLILLYGQDVAHAKILEGIATQLRAVYEGGMLGEDRKYSGIGLHRIRSDEVQKEVEMINRYAYDRRQLALSYEGRGAVRIELPHFSTGLLIYASDKDRLYLIGENSSEEEELRVFILDVAKILEIKETDQENAVFQSERYMRIYREMMVVDLDPPEQVRIAVAAGNPNLLRKFERHVKVRNEGLPKGQEQAAFEAEEDRYIYSDTVRGLSELSRFLRQYGMSITVLEPEGLKEKMLFTAKRALERYEVSDNG